MNQLEYFLLDLGLSWTLAKATPYIFCVLLGIYMFYILRKIQLKWKWLKVIFLFLVFTTPFLLYFSFFPIYEGDFTDQGVLSKNSSIEFPVYKALTVVVLPNCPYCYQSIKLMQKIKKRNSNISINYWVSTHDTLPAKTAILKDIPPDFNVIQRHDIEQISEMVKGTYPCFILSDKGKAIKQWNNNQIGVSALDEMEKFFSN